MQARPPSIDLGTRLKPLSCLETFTRHISQRTESGVLVFVRKFQLLVSQDVSKSECAWLSACGTNISVKCDPLLPFHHQTPTDA